MFCRNSREVLFKNSSGNYLQENGTVGDKSSSVIVTEEVVSSRISRFKIGEKYISCILGKPSLSEIKDDSTLFVCEKQLADSPETTLYYTIGGLCLSLTNVLCCQKYSDLILESAFEEQLYRKFSKEGIVTWQGCFYGIEIARNKVLEKKHTRISNLFYDPIFEAFLKDETMKRLLDRVYGQKQYHLTTYSSNTLRKEDKDGRFFHVDYPYHNIPSPYPDEILGIQVIFALDDFTVENGATMYVPGSHKDHKFPDKSILFCLENSKYTIVQKGSIILYRGDIWHSQGINITENPRVAILANFSPLSVLAKDDVVSHVSGSYCDFKIVDGKVLI